ncbi:hypothetical protein BKA62DRAFT_760533 [Auriculariales sp. MPI-PUGE-AT-0066]|nr:hypothetical protein BKA62DRAFT_760533 [Auriculariales sp. MPI-PUGE-AT-0066]
MSRLITIALALYAVQAAPLSKRGTTLDDPDCLAHLPTTPDQATVDTIYKALVDKNATTFETCLQESHCNNIDCGDQDSIGAFQQRPSMGWGTKEQIMDAYYSAGKFIEAAIPLDTPGATADGIAQGVQRAELGNLYAGHFDEANQLIADAKSRAGGGGGATTSPPSGGGETTGSTTGSCSPSGGAAPPPPPPGSFPPLVPPPGTDTSGDCTSVTAVAGDSCWAIANAHGIDVGTFLSKNPSLDAACSNLQAGSSYCV